MSFSLFITFLLLLSRLLPSSDPALEVHGAISWPCVHLAEIWERHLGKVIYLFIKEEFSLLICSPNSFLSHWTTSSCWRTVQTCSDRQLICLTALTASSVSPLCGRCFLFQNFCWLQWVLACAQTCTDSAVQCWSLLLIFIYVAVPCFSLQREGLKVVWGGAGVFCMLVKEWFSPGPGVPVGPPAQLRGVRPIGVQISCQTVLHKSCVKKQKEANLLLSCVGSCWGHSRKIPGLALNLEVESSACARM